MRVPINSEFDPSKLSEELSVALGRPVALSARQPGQKDERGNALRGLIDLIDPATGDRIEGLDEKAVGRVVAQHKRAEPPPPGQPLADALADVTTLAGLKAALVKWAGGR